MSTRWRTGVAAATGKAGAELLLPLTIDSAQSSAIAEHSRSTMPKYRHNLEGEHLGYGAGRLFCPNKGTTFGCSILSQPSVSEENPIEDFCWKFDAENAPRV
jgi:hypothetical protein